MDMDLQYVNEMNKSISGLFKRALKITVGEPSKAAFLIRTIGEQRRAAGLRMNWEDRGIHVPAFMITSITKRCNLRCKGCYAMVQNRDLEEEMQIEKLADIYAEAGKLGISIILIAGGEPLARPEIVDVAGSFPHIIFPLFTNGMLIDDGISSKLKKYKNIVPVISIEGLEENTDARRGSGVAKTLREVFSRLSRDRIFWGVSFTVTEMNHDTVTGDALIKDLIAMGCKLFFFVEYIPVKEGTEPMVVSVEHREGLLRRLDVLRKQYNSLFIAFPGDEQKFGGCLSSGRGFIHISPGGNVEPCPFAPYSDASLANRTLKEALQSKFLLKIRQNYRELSEGEGGCALWEKRDWVRALLGIETTR